MIIMIIMIIIIVSIIMITITTSVCCYCCFMSKVVSQRLPQEPALKNIVPLQEPPHIFDLRSRRSKTPPPSSIFDLRPRRSKNPPIFDLRPRRMSRRSGVLIRGVSYDGGRSNRIAGEIYTLLYRQCMHIYIYMYIYIYVYI